jgi:hypothetical protein
MALEFGTENRKVAANCTVSVMKLYDFRIAVMFVLLFIQWKINIFEYEI